jgi:hypothetical protein
MQVTLAVVVVILNIHYYMSTMYIYNLLRHLINRFTGALVPRLRRSTPAESETLRHRKKDVRGVYLLIHVRRVELRAMSYMYVRQQCQAMLVSIWDHSILSINEIDWPAAFIFRHQSPIQKLDFLSRLERCVGYFLRKEVCV